MDAGQEGRGVVRRAATVLIGVAWARGFARMEIKVLTLRKPDPPQPPDHDRCDPCQTAMSCHGDQ